MDTYEDETEKIVQALAREIRSHMAMQRVTMREVSERSGMSIATISRLSRGERSPDISQLSRLANALRISIRELIGTAFDG